MDELSATRAKLRCLEMVQGTDLSWKDVVRFKDTKHPVRRSLDDYECDTLEFALGVVEGKPVWPNNKGE